MEMLTEFLARRGVTLAAVGAEVAQKLGLREGEWAFASGSLVEGLGNPMSDLDVYLVSADPERLAQRSPATSITYAGFVVDVEVCGIEELESLVERFERWAGAARTIAACFLIRERERLTLHRLITAVPVWGDPAPLLSLQRRISVEALARHKLDWSIAWITTLQVDLEGLRCASDWETTVPLSSDLLGFTVDALLAAYRRTNPTTKWRIPLLRGLPSNWEQGLPGRATRHDALQTVMDLLCAASMSSDAARERTMAILAFSRRILPWAEATILGSEEPLLGPSPASGNDGPPMGRLGIAVQFGYRDGHYVVTDVSRCGYRVEVSAAILSRLCLFDGICTTEDPRRRADVSQLPVLDQVRALVRFFGFGLWDPDVPGAERGSVAAGQIRELMSRSP